VIAGRWGFDELAQRIVEQCRIHRAVAAIETNAGGEYVAQAVEKAVPVMRLHTSQASKRMRVEMLCSELAGGRWSFRQPGFLDPQMKQLTQELLSFSYHEHMGDRVAALLVAVEAIRQREQRPKLRSFRTDLFTR
jgi:phage terminase large subunit-like protein